MGAKRKFLLAIIMVMALPSVAAAQQATAPTTATAAPAASAGGGGIQIPEPGDLALFLIGVAGLIVGRWSARSRKRNQE